MTEINFTNALASHCLAIGNGAIAPEIYRIASHSLLDWIAVGRYAWKEPALQIPLDCCIEEGGNPQATLLSGHKASCSQAALLNGIASHIFDFDDVHLRSRVHPSVPLWSAILAEGELMNAPIEQLLRAFIVGVEMQSRLAFVIGEDHYKLGWHNTATLGAFGASAAVAYLKEMTASELATVLGICGTQAAGLRIAFGTMCKPLHAGKAALTGLNSAKYAAKGFNGPKNIFDTPGGIFALYANHSFPENVFDKPEHLCIKDIIYKYNASCYGTQAPIEACKILMETALYNPSAINSVDVTIETQYLSVCCIPKPSTATEAKFSIKYMCALTLLGYSTTASSSFEADLLSNAKINKLMTKINILSNTSLPRANAVVKITNRDGNSFSNTYNANSPESDLDHQEFKIRSKALSLLCESMSSVNANKLIDAVLINKDLKTAQLMSFIPIIH
ncbi:MmgE/PrpD family protein [Polynucleobacter sp. AP-Melu-500A-A1]|uniref:MmgE/PrpD family protein n=1 Tax=Polynucleobacter sp. AP-Melu-500A-A1 TaxID=2576929 RepID=UPI001C0B5571|nr:MmgE/PrpD family protein [Polynucleobacter sp. AP-Melu-500A-A1]